jgi:hypothetical protein
MVAHGTMVVVEGGKQEEDSFGWRHFWKTVETDQLIPAT